MTNNFLILGTLAAFGWTFVSGTQPSTEATPRSSASRVAAADSSRATYAAGDPVLEARQAPVPLVRSSRPPREAPPLAAPSADTQQQPQDDLDRKAAKAAVEADGYRRVTVLGKASNGAWRVKGFRGATEVLLTVDGTGKVSMD